MNVTRHPVKTPARSGASLECSESLLRGVPGVMWFIRCTMGNRRVAGMSMAQFRVLVVIDRIDDVSLSGVASCLGASVPTISRIVTGLVAKGHLSRTEAPDDRRRCKLALTARGRAALKLAHDMTRDALAEHMAHVPATQCRLITESMQILATLFPGEPASCAKLVSDE